MIFFLVWCLIGIITICFSKLKMFKITRNFVRLALLITGILILVSYAVGFMRLENPTDLWGGIPDSWIPFILVFMGFAVIGYIVFCWFFLFHWDPKVVDTVQWPWQKYRQADVQSEHDEHSEHGEVIEQNEHNIRKVKGGGGYIKILIAFMFFNIPSMFWLELTALHMELRKTWTQVLVIGNLWLVCLGNILLFLLALSAHRQKIAAHTIWPLIGTIFLGIQVIINDGILWNVYYPW